MSQQLQKDGIGVAIDITITEDGIISDLSTTTVKTLKFKKPDRVTVTKTPGFVTNGSDGKVRYITETGFLDQAGTWQVIPYFEFASGFKGYAKIGEFVVKSNL